MKWNVFFVCLNMRKNSYLLYIGNWLPVSDNDNIS